MYLYVTANEIRLYPKQNPTKLKYVEECKARVDYIDNNFLLSARCQIWVYPKIAIARPVCGEEPELQNIEKEPVGEKSFALDMYQNAAVRKVFCKL